MTHKTSSHPAEQAAPAAPVESTSGLSIASLILGILSLTGFLFLTGIPAIITGIIALRKGQGERSMSLAGIIMGSIGTFISLLGLLLIVALIFIGMNADPSFTPELPTQDVNMPIQSSET